MKTEAAIEKTPLLIGLHAARANLVPGLLIQAAMLAAVLSYYFFPPAQSFFGLLARAKARGGFVFTISASMIAGAILPQALTVCIFQGGKIRRENGSELLFLALLWSFDGCIVDTFYRLQSAMFGSHVDVATVAKKVLVDMFIFNPFLAAPMGMFFYEWKNQRYSPRGMSRAWTWTFYKSKTVPALCATWAVWIPVTAAIYSLPPLLQIPLFSLALTFWVMLFAYITAGKNGVPIPAGESAILSPAAK